MSLTTDALAALLRREIEHGLREQGEQMPSIPELMQQFDVGKGVAQNAVKRLRDAGLIATKPGGKTFVQGGLPRLIVQEPVPDVGRGDPVALMTVLESAEVPAPDFVSEPLGLDGGEPVYLRRGVYGWDVRIVRLISAYVPVDIARGSAIVYTELGEGGIHARLAEQGFEVSRLGASVVSRPAEDDEEKVMGLRRGTWVLEVTRTAWAGRRCVEVVRSVLDARVHELRFSLPS